jgi:hypothetical protein
VNEILSLWKSPLDAVAVQSADEMLARQPQCSVQIDFTTSFDAMTIYNYGQYVVNTGQGATHNTSALSNMFLAMSSAPYGGGAAFIPQDQFPVSASMSGLAVPDQCDIIGSGGGGQGFGLASDFHHFVIHGTGAVTFLNCTGTYTAGGKYFRSLAFEWYNPTNTEVTATCISAATQNCRVINCTFTNCPVAFNASGDSCVLAQCTIEYLRTAGQGPNGTKAVVLSGNRCSVLGPGEFAQEPQSPADMGATGCTCISIEGAAAHTVIASIHLSEWSTGVDFSQSAGQQDTDIRNCEAQCFGTALNIQLPQNAGGATTSAIKVTSGVFAKSGTSTDSGAVIKIDAALSFGFNTNDQLYDISLTDCTVFSQASTPINGQHGLEIVGGTNIRVLGGTYSNNGPDGGAGVAITGPCGDVQIIGANLQPTYVNSNKVNSQTYALAITAVPSGSVSVTDCDMTGYTAPVNVSVALSDNELFISNCPGYNDQSAPLNNGVPPLAPGVSAAKCTTPYFGPSVFTFSNAQPVTLEVFGQAITASYGVIFLPSPYDNFYFTEPPSSFSWIGK